MMTSARRAATLRETRARVPRFAAVIAGHAACGRHPLIHSLSHRNWGSPGPNDPGYRWRAAFEPSRAPQVLSTYILHQYRELERLNMSKDAVFTMKLEPELRDEFMAEAEAAHRPASQVLRELMREFIQRQREAREYDDFLRSKVDAGRASMHAGMGRSNDEIEAEFAARRAKVAHRA